MESLNQLKPAGRARLTRISLGYSQATRIFNTSQFYSVHMQSTCSIYAAFNE